MYVRHVCTMSRRFRRHTAPDSTLKPSLMSRPLHEKKSFRASSPETTTTLFCGSENQPRIGPGQDARWTYPQQVERECSSAVLARELEALGQEVKARAEERPDGADTVQREADGTDVVIVSGGGETPEQEQKDDAGKDDDDLEGGVFWEPRLNQGKKAEGIHGVLSGR